MAAEPQTERDHSERILPSAETWNDESEMHAESTQSANECRVQSLITLNHSQSANTQSITFLSAVGTQCQLRGSRVDEDLLVLQDGHVDAEQNGAHRDARIHQRHCDRVAAR